MTFTRSATLLFLGLIGALAVFASPAAADCYDEEDICTDRAQESNDRCWDICERRYEDNFNAWDRCTDRCDDAEDSDVASCERRADQCHAGDTQGPAGVMHGSRDSGGDGCYFGECPDGNTTQTSQRQQQTGTNNWPSGRNTPPPPPPSQITSICQTPLFWCRLNMQGPVGAPCYCNSPVGYANGISVPER